jgi:hypothetical protein
MFSQPSQEANRLMETMRKRHYLIGFYVSVLFVLLICVSATPMLIRHGVLLTRRILIEEDVLETALIVALLGISYLISRSFMRSLQNYQRAVDRAGQEKSKLVSRLSEAFSYIGTVNVELHEIESVLRGPPVYPKNKREFKALVDQLAVKAMTVAAAPWMIVRMIDRNSGHTVNEHTVQRPQGGPAPVTLGNRAILEGRKNDDFQTISTRQRNLDIETVFILPKAALSEEKTFLLAAILNQIEMIFMLHRSGCLRQPYKNETTAE